MVDPLDGYFPHLWVFWLKLVALGVGVSILTLVILFCQGCWMRKKGIKSNSKKRIALSLICSIYAVCAITYLWII